MVQVDTGLETTAAAAALVCTTVGVNSGAGSKSATLDVVMLLPPAGMASVLLAVVQAPTEEALRGLGTGTGPVGIVTAEGIVETSVREAVQSRMKVVVNEAGISRTGRAGTAGSVRATGTWTAAAAGTQEGRLAADTAAPRQPTIQADTQALATVRAQPRVAAVATKGLAEPPCTGAREAANCMAVAATNM